MNWQKAIVKKQKNPKKQKTLKKRAKKKRTEDIPLKEKDHIDILAKALIKQFEEEDLSSDYIGVSTILQIVGSGAFLAPSTAIPDLPKVLKPFLSDPSARQPWDRFNIPYLKRLLKRLEKQRLVQIGEEEGVQIAKITSSGKRRILKYALNSLSIEKPKKWDGVFRMIAYDIPKEHAYSRNVFRKYLRKWGFYPLGKSLYLHAYPCQPEINCLRQYLCVEKFVRILKVSYIENSEPIRRFFKT